MQYSLSHAAHSNLRAEILLAEGVANQKLDSMMRRAFNDVYLASRKYHTYPRAAAYVLAVGRVAEATMVRGLFP